MFQKLQDLWTKWSQEGIRVPYFYDPETDRPSITLMFFWISSFLSLISLILLHLQLVTYTATGTSLLFVLLAFVMYRLRKLDKVKIDLKNESVDLEDDNKPIKEKDGK